MAEVYEITRKALSELYDIEHSGCDLNETPYMVMEVLATFGDAGCEKYRKPFVDRCCRDLAEAENRLAYVEKRNLEIVGMYCSCAADYEIWKVVDDEGGQDVTKDEPADEQEQVDKSASGPRVFSARYMKDGKVVGAYESHEINDVLSMVSCSINAFDVVDGRRLFDCCNVCLNVEDALGNYGRVIYKVRPYGSLTFLSTSTVEASMPAVRDLFGLDLATLVEYLNGFSMCLCAVKYGEVAL